MQDRHRFLTMAGGGLLVLAAPGLAQAYLGPGLGLGAIGAATFYQFAQRGTKVLGIDQFSPPHDQGSSHGESRISRLAIGEGDEYVPLVHRSHQVWREREARTERSIFTDEALPGLVPRYLATKPLSFIHATTGSAPSPAISIGALMPDEKNPPITATSM